MKYLFVLGRNPKLSAAEIFAWLEKSELHFNKYELRDNALLIESDKIDIKRTMIELGGCIAIGRVFLSGDKESVLREIKEKQIYQKKEIKVIYSVLNYASDEYFEEVLEAIKNNFRNERLKARYKGVSGTIKMQTGEIMHGSPEKIMLRDMNYFVFCAEGSKEVHFGALEESYDVEEAEKRDMQKPYRRESLAISPRLARILINLSQVKNGEILLDPFCGIGVILGEAMLKGMDVIGIDIDSDAIKNAKRNIDWLRSNYKIEARAKMINGDSKSIKVNDNISGIATEPSLGELMTKPAQREKALQILSEFEKLLIDVLNNLKKFMKKGAKIAFTAPLIMTSDRKRVGCDIENICEKTDLRVYELKGAEIIRFPIQEFRNEQIVGREIFVLVD